MIVLAKNAKRYLTQSAIADLRLWYVYYSNIKSKFIDPDFDPQQWQRHFLGTQSKENGANKIGHLFQLFFLLVLMHEFFNIINYAINKGLNKNDQRPVEV